MDTLISIIVPVYNVEKYIDRCVESIVNQTYKNLEIILVDDGSTDGSAAKCEDWVKRDNRIVAIHKNNGGQGEARNRGLESSKGEYVGFVDSDDYISPKMYSDMLALAKTTNADVVGCRHIVFDDKTVPIFDDDTLTQIVKMTQEEAVEDIIREKHFESTVWNLLVRSSIAKNVKFDIGVIHEDILWPFKVILKCQIIIYTETPYYAYFQRIGSTMNSSYSEKRFDALDALETRADIIKKVYPNLFELATSVYLGACMYHYQSLCRLPQNNEYKNYKKILHKRFCSGDRNALFDGLKFDYKIWYTMFRVSPNLTCKIRNTLKIGL